MPNTQFGLLHIRQELARYTRSSACYRKGGRRMRSAVDRVESGVHCWVKSHHGVCADKGGTAAHTDVLLELVRLGPMLIVCKHRPS